ncbi:hypothetical protein [Streptomyces chrestomyceticus]|uniref:hypothetical protein n=1 Tax=Streptomyces chrestomyceticus TaxID=68185 RepID=UPI00378B151C
MTLILDPGDDVVHTRAALSAHVFQDGRITVHPAPGTDSTLALAYDVLAALGKPVPLTGYRQLDTAPAWAIAAAWILAPPVTHLTLLRAHLLSPRRLHALFSLRERTGLRLALVCHRPDIPVALDQALTGTRHRIADATALLPAADSDAAALQDTGPAHPLAGRWLNLPALTTLMAYDGAGRDCRCAAPLASERDFFPPVMPPATTAEVAHRLHGATAHPHLAAELATAVFTAASVTQLDTVHVHDLAPDASTVTVHDDGLRYGCVTHPVPPWARSLLQAAAHLWRIAAGTDGPLFTDPLGSKGLPYLTDVAESCKLRPPQPRHPKRRRRGRRKKARPKPPPETFWPLCTAHYHSPWAMKEEMYGCPWPPPHTQRTIAARKKGWLPPDYGHRNLRPPR